MWSTPDEVDTRGKHRGHTADPAMDRQRTLCAKEACGVPHDHDRPPLGEAFHCGGRTLNPGAGGKTFQHSLSSSILRDRNTCYVSTLYHVARAGEVDADEAIVAADALCGQALEAQAEDMAIEDTLYSLERAFQTGVLDAAVYLKQVCFLT